MPEERLALVELIDEDEILETDGTGRGAERGRGPDAFAFLNAVISRRNRSTPRTLTVVHGGVGSLGDVEAEAGNQGELLSRCRQAYVDHWAVTLLPPPATPTGWAPVQAFLRSIPDHHWIEMKAGAWGLAAQVVGGRVDVEAVLGADDPWAELEGRLAWSA